MGKYWFRGTVTGLVLAGALILFFSTHQRHRIRPDDTTYPKVPTDAPVVNR